MKTRIAARVVCASLVVFLATAAVAFAAEPGKKSKTARAKSAGSAQPEITLSLPAPDRILATLRKEHPRLILTPERLAAVKSAVKKDRLAATIYADVQREAQKLLDKPPSKYEIPDGRRLLSVSREVLSRVGTLAFVYHMTGDRRFADRAWVELDAAAKFPDWNPSHFLDTAEMTHAFAIGYDWLYDCWTNEQRATLREAIVRLGITPAMKFYEPKPSGFARNTNNWNQVCNGGIGMGALAIADVEPALAAKVLTHAIGTMPRALHVYAPDGGGTEGVTYWSYAARYATPFFECLRTALGTDFGLSKVDGWPQSGDFHLYFSGAEHDSFNFGDCGETRLSAPEHFWMGRHYDIPRYSWFRYQELTRSPQRGNVYDLLWYDPSAAKLDPKQFALDKHFRSAELATMRSAWGDPKAIVLAIEGAPPADYSHRHLDSGSFILEADGVRWVVDCGTEHETYLSHQHKYGRWDFYRTRAEGHNTLVLNPGRGPDQQPNTPAPFTRFESSAKDCTAEMDLSKAYEGQAQRVTRTFSMIDRKKVQIRDEVRGAKGADLWWFLHTKAQVEVTPDGRSATLRQGSKRLNVALLEPSAARFEVMPAEALPMSPKVTKQADNSKIRKLAIRLQKVNDLKLAVELAPGS
ncbi:MAG: heparinase II/III domain-containing protein [Planctomycetota bacterium]